MTAPEYVAARRVLLDALDALHDHLGNLVLVGAQAVYLHTGQGTLAVPPMTTDADLALNTTRLADRPEIAETLTNAGFTPSGNPGHWLGSMDVAIDIMVAPHQAGTTSRTARAARIPPHAKTVGRIAPGLEPALVDNTTRIITAFEDGDHRAHQLRVANPAALLVAKAVKIAEREDDAIRQPGRLKAKDALDMFRLLQAVETDQLVIGFHTHQADPEAARVSEQARAVIQAQGATPTSRLPLLAAEASFGDPTVAPAFAALARQLIQSLS